MLILTGQEAGSPSEPQRVGRWVGGEKSPERKVAPGGFLAAMPAAKLSSKGQHGFHGSDFFLRQSIKPSP